MATNQLSIHFIRKALFNDCCGETTNHGFALPVWQHHVLVAFYIRDFLRSHARCFWFLQNATGYSFKHLWISRALASEKEQGRAFGILEGGRNSVDMVTGAILLTVFAYRGADDDALSEQIFIYASFALILALIVWLMAIISMSAYCGYYGAYFFTPYATEVFELGSVLGVTISNAKLWIAALVAVVAGFIADKIGPAKAVLIFLS